MNKGDSEEEILKYYFQYEKEIIERRGIGIIIYIVSLVCILILFHLINIFKNGGL
jgi:hypothetical protein